MGVNPKIWENPKSSHLFIGFSIIFPIHFGGKIPFFGKHPYTPSKTPQKTSRKNLHPLNTTPWLGGCSQPTRIWVATLEPLATFTSNGDNKKKGWKTGSGFAERWDKHGGSNARFLANDKKESLLSELSSKKKLKWLQEPCLWAWKTYSPIEKWQESQLLC